MTYIPPTKEWLAHIHGKDKVVEKITYTERLTYIEVRFSGCSCEFRFAKENINANNFAFSATHCPIYPKCGLIITKIWADLLQHLENIGGEEPIVEEKNDFIPDIYGGYY